MINRAKLAGTILLIAVAVLSCAEEADPSLVFIRGGSFLMGVEGGEDNPAHEVRVDSFLISRYELTVGEWRRFVEDTRIAFPWDHFEFRTFARWDEGVLPDDWPMYWLSWYDAVWYCNWLSEREGLKPAYELDTGLLRRYLYERKRGEEVPMPEVRWNPKADGYRLPTEAEWEYAATEGRKLSEAETLARLDEVAWYRGNAELSPYPVGSKKPNSFGLYDMLGNLAEWCWDYYDTRYYRSSPKDNPRGPDKGYDPEIEADPHFYKGAAEIVRCVRGGGWLNLEDYCSLRVRYGIVPGYRSSIGFRLARNAKGSR